VEQQLAHDEEQGDRHQREAGDRGGGIGHQLVDADEAAHEDDDADHVDGEEGNRHRHAEEHQKEEAAAHQRGGVVPGHQCAPPRPE
jgi:hypothetical protein